MKTNELTGAALDWAAAKCEGNTFAGEYPHLLQSGFRPPKYSTDWAQGGPIIEREAISIDHTTMRGQGGNYAWCATLQSGPAVSEAYGLTPLIAAMRCLVASRLGDEVEVPQELAP